MQGSFLGPLFVQNFWKIFNPEKCSKLFLKDISRSLFVIRTCLISFSAYVGQMGKFSIPLRPSLMSIISRLRHIGYVFWEIRKGYLVFYSLTRVYSHVVHREETSFCRIWQNLWIIEFFPNLLSTLTSVIERLVLHQHLKMDI